MGELAERQALTRTRIGALQHELTAAEGMVRGKACVYVTGSFGRGEAGQYSDLDLFILGKTTTNGRDSLLTQLNEICVKAELIRVTRDLGFPEFSGDGKYITGHSVFGLINTLGRSNDDSSNTFTARLLLLLESFPLLEKEIYEDLVKVVISQYWRDYDDHKDNFMPAFLANDILRLWRTLCVNYEASLEKIPAEKKAKGKLKNYKLKHSRLLTCYSALIYLLALYERQKSVSPQDALSMVKLTPIGRLEWLKTQSEFSEIHGNIDNILMQYEDFLGKTNKEEDILINEFRRKERSRRSMQSASRLGDLIFDTLKRLGSDSKFYRLLVV